MKSRNVKIIDKTLNVLWEKHKKYVRIHIDSLVELCRGLNIIGCNYFEVNEELYEILKPIVPEIQFLIVEDKTIELKSCEELKNIDKDIAVKRVSGLSDLIFYNYKDRFKDIKNNFGQDIQLEIKDHYGCAVAMANEWINYGGTVIVGSFTGIGGYTAIESLLCSVKFINKLDLPGNTTIVPKVISVFEELVKQRIYDKMPIIGEKIFDVESGIHVDGIIKNPQNYEPYSPSNVGRERRIIIGKHTGRNALELKLKELNIPFDNEFIKDALIDVRRESNKKRRGLKDSEVYAICKKRGVI